MKLTATKQYHSTPISEKLASNFIELGYGLQVEGMIAELFFNRSFEPFYPYRLINKLWYDLLEDENDHSSRCETDWRVFDWYHSSYEHNAWFAFPGTAGHQPIEDDSTFVIEHSPMADVHIAIVKGGCHGEYAMQVINDSDAHGGLAQDGKYCFTDVKYTFNGKIRRTSGDPALQIAIYREGSVSDPVVTCPLGTVGDDYTKVQAEFSVPEQGRYTFALLLPPHTSVLCDDFSLLPDDAVCRMKKSAVEAGAYVAPAVIRWPGGCFASFYNWRDGVGEYRPPMKSYFWGGYQYNDVGTDELASYAEAVGAESMICVNVHHPFKRYFEYVPPESLDKDPNDPTIHAAPHGRDLPCFADIARGAQEAAAWVEYCNGDESTEGGRARIANGRKKPYNVKYWEMDNEVHRWFTPEEYARTCVLYAKTMKAVDPTIKIGIDTYSYSLEALERMVAIAGNDIDFIADRGSSEDTLQKKLAIICAYNQQQGTGIRYCNTEWLPLRGTDAYNMVPRGDNKLTKCYMFSKWKYALDAASVLMMWQRYGQVIDFVNFNNLANTHAQSAIETPKEGAYPTAAGMMLHRFANTCAYRTLVIDGYNPDCDDMLQAQLSINRDGTALVLNILNRGEEDGEVVLDLGVFTPVCGTHGGVMLCADSLAAMNTLHDRPIAEKSISLCLTNSVATVAAPARSFAEYVIPLTE
ncbi:MAG: hypothetical protein E7581_01310 [Ruminococcaceae bacterium]|nr:hypothetical protein [Oscillospiraceae bacterium]